MAANTVNGSGNGARSGAQTLGLLAAPLSVLLLRALGDGAKPQAELRRLAGSPAQSTLRAQLRRLAEIGAVERHRRNAFPGALEYELTPQGRDLLPVLDALEHWLGQAPNGQLKLGSGPAKAAIMALAEGWSTTMLRALAARPLALTELDGVIGALSYPSLERRLASLRVCGLVEPCPGRRNGTPYTATEWLRLGIGPIGVAARWERRHRPDAAPLGPLDLEAMFLLAVPLVQPFERLRGSCRLAAESQNGKRGRLAGVVVELRPDGSIGPCTTRLDRYSDAWALGSSAAWLDALIDRDLDRLELGGDCRLASYLAEGLHDALFTQRIELCP